LILNFSLANYSCSLERSGHNASLNLLLLLIRLMSFLLFSLNFSVEFVAIEDEFGLFKNLKNSLSGDNTIVVSI